MTVAENKALVRRFTDLVNAGRLEEALALCRPDLVLHTAGRRFDRRGLGQLLANDRTALPDLAMTIAALVAEGDRVVARYTLAGTHRGQLTSVSGLDVPPTGRQVVLTGIMMYRLVAGQVAELWEELDRLSLLQHLGVVPRPESPG